jgi:hypothetical protein
VPQLSQFDKQATLQADGRVHVGGSVTQQAEPVHFHFALVQNGEIRDGRGESSGDRWAGTTDRPGLEEGRAVALGLAVTLREGPTAGFETFTWVEEVTISR